MIKGKKKKLSSTQQKDFVDALSLVQYTEDVEEEDSFESETCSFGCELDLPDQLSDDFKTFYVEF